MRFAAQLFNSPPFLFSSILDRIASNQRTEHNGSQQERTRGNF